MKIESCGQITAPFASIIDVFRSQYKIIKSQSDNLSFQSSLSPSIQHLSIYVLSFHIGIPLYSVFTVTVYLSAIFYGSKCQQLSNHFYYTIHVICMYVWVCLLLFVCAKTYVFLANINICIGPE